MYLGNGRVDLRDEVRDALLEQAQRLFLLGIRAVGDLVVQVCVRPHVHYLALKRARMHISSNTCTLTWKRHASAGPTTCFATCMWSQASDGPQNAKI
jgi:hypothetical protein